MKFTKMQGCGNDYIYVNCFEENIDDRVKTTIAVSDRHFGIGADGLICICSSAAADFRMEMYNADGSKGKMCGNGIRCLAKYVYDHKMTQKTQLTVETPAGIKSLELYIEDEKVKAVQVDMGKPEFTPEKIPVLIPGCGKERIINEKIETCAGEYAFSAVSMGNPHAVLRVENTDKAEVEKIGPELENHPYFPERINTEFIEIIDEENIKMRVFERGSGETLACGTGACAAAVISFICGWTKRRVTVHLRGGDLDIEYKEDGNVYMTGPAEEVFSGQWSK